MSERRPFSELTEDFSAERRQRIDAIKLELLKAAGEDGLADPGSEDGADSEPPLWLIVTGPPAGGKTTLIRCMSRDLRIPTFEKDAIKDTLYQSLGFGDKDWSRRIGLATINILFAIASQMLEARQSLITEANFYRQYDSERATEVLRQVSARVVQVHCSAPTEVLIERNARRRTPAEQRLGHHVMPDNELIAGIEAGTWEPLDIPSEIIRVDTPREADYETMLERVRSILTRSSRA
ncbi:MAG: ATP-binding protein [Dehalococcoidia bacterium]|nr:ATP-binding protein [Dehalococcoidia bacterium]